MKIKLTLFIIFSFICASAQESVNSEKVNFYGGFESNSQWYLNDKGLNVEHPETPLRANSYLFANLKYKNWITGVQVESYEDEALLNFNPQYDKTDVATYFLQFKNEKIDIVQSHTLGNEKASTRVLKNVALQK